MNSNILEDNSFTISSSMKIDHVHLKVSDLEKSITFYKNILGFDVIETESDEKTAFLSPSQSISNSVNNDINNVPVLVALTKIECKNVSQVATRKREAGLYHFAILLPERKFLAAILRHIQNNLDRSYYEGLADHGMSEAIYIHDPDFNGIEIYTDRLPSTWQLNKNKDNMVTIPLNVESLLKEYEGITWDGLPANTRIGHVHLHVSNVERAKVFYHKILGLNLTYALPSAYFFAADNYHHHIAANTWLGTHISKANSSNNDSQGLDHYAISLPNQKEMSTLKERLKESEIRIDEVVDNSNNSHSPSFYIYDHDGIKVEVVEDKITDLTCKRDKNYSLASGF